MFKFGILEHDNPTEFVYPNEYALQQTSGPIRIIISSATNQMKLASDLIIRSDSYFGILYILAVPRGKHKAARYQLADRLSKNDAVKFLEKYNEYFVNDGRHQIWIADTENNDFIVYDQHNVLYAYGNISEYEKILGIKRYQNTTKIEFPVPHVHCYNPEYDH